MPRHARRLSEKGIYHVMLRGNNKEKIFIDDYDKSRMVDTLSEKKKISGYYLYAYCIMDNHLHIILREGNETISKAIKRIASSYAHYFNKKYKKIGHVFQDRYLSECIEDDRYLLAAVRYVHQNPVKAGIGSLKGYKWSSYAHYINGNDTIVDTSEILEMISSNNAKAIREFVRFNNEVADERFIDFAGDKEINEANISEFINSFLMARNIALEELKETGNRDIRDELIKGLVERSNLSKRAIASALGLNRELVRRVSMYASP